MLVTLIEYAPSTAPSANATEATWTFDTEDCMPAPPRASSTDRSEVCSAVSLVSRAVSSLDCELSLSCWAVSNLTGRLAIATARLMTFWKSAEKLLEPVKVELALLPDVELEIVLIGGSTRTLLTGRPVRAAPSD